MYDIGRSQLSLPEPPLSV